MTFFFFFFLLVSSAHPIMTGYIDSGDQGGDDFFFFFFFWLVSSAHPIMTGSIGGVHIRTGYEYASFL